MLGQSVLFAHRVLQPNVMLYVLCWSQDVASGQPLICVTGQTSKIFVLDVQTGTLAKVTEIRAMGVLTPTEIWF